MDKVVKGPGNVGDVDVHQTLEDINEIMQAFIDTASVDRAYGSPVEVGDTVIIPAAENLVVMGFVAGGFGSAEEESEQEAPTTSEGEGGGGGGGGRTFSRPVAIIVASPGGVRVEPVFDRTKIAMAAITAAGFMAGMLFRMTRGPKLE